MMQRITHTIKNKGVVIGLAVMVALSSLCGVVLVEAATAPPNMISYQGRVLDSNGVPVSDATLNMEFRIYDGTNTCRWSNDDSACGSTALRSVTLSTGLFSEMLGDTGDSYAAIPDSLFSTYNELYLEVRIGAEVLSPRKRLGATPYALNAQTLDGIDSTSFLLASNDLSDLNDAPTARTNLGVAIDSDVQAYDADLSAIGALAKTDGNFIVGNGSTWVAESGATVRASLGLGSLATLSSVDVSDNTNLVAGTNVTLADDTLNVDDAFLLNTGDTGSGDYTFTGDLTVQSGVRIGIGSTPDSITALADDTLFVEGATEFDGAMRLDSTVDANGAITASGGITSDANEVLISGGNLQLNDGIILSLGSDDDLQLSHSGSAGTLANATGGMNFRVIDNSSVALRMGESTNDYITLDTTNNNEQIIFGNTTTDQSFRFNSSAAVTIDGNADGSDALILTAGDILVTDGDLDLSGGDFNVVLDAADGASISNTASSSSTPLLTISNTSAAVDTSGTKGLSVAQAITDYADDNATDVHVGMSVTMAHNASDAGFNDNVYGVQVTNLGGTAQSGNEFAIYQSGYAWDYGLYIEDAAYFDSTVDINGALGLDAITVTPGSDTTALTLDGASVTTANLFSISTANTTGNVVDIDANALTTGDGISLTSSSGALSSGDLGYLYHNGTYTASETISGNVLHLERNIISSGAGTNVTTSGSILYIANDVAGSGGGTSNDNAPLAHFYKQNSSPGNVLKLQSDSSDGAAFMIDQSSDATAIHIDSSALTDTVLDIDTANSSGNVIDIEADNLISGGDVLSLSVAALSATGSVIDINSAGDMNGDADFISATHTRTSTDNVSVTGQMLDLKRDITSNYGGTNYNLAGNVASFSRELTANSGTLGASGALVNISNTSSGAGTITDTATLLLLDQDTAGATGDVIDIDSESLTADAVNIDVVNTSGTVIDLNLAATSASSVNMIDVSLAPTTGASSAQGVVIAANPATGATLSGDLLELTMDAVDADGFTGDALKIVIDTDRSTGKPIHITNDAAASIFEVNEAGNITTVGDLNVNGGNISSTGVLAIESATTNALTLNSGSTGTINIGVDSDAESVNVGTGAGAKTVTVGSSNTTSQTTLQAGSGGVTIDASGQIGIGSASTSQINFTTDNTASNDLVFNGGATFQDNLTVSGTNGSVTLDGDASTLLDIDPNGITSGDVITNTFDSSTTQTGNFTMYSMDLNTNYSLATNYSTRGMSVKTPTASSTSAHTTEITAFYVTPGGHLTTNPGTLSWHGLKIDNPNVTQTSGSLSANGVTVDIGTFTTGGTQVGLQVLGQGTGTVGSANEYGIHLDGGTVGAGNEYAIQIDTGWDHDINLQNGEYIENSVDGSVALRDTDTTIIWSGSKSVFNINLSDSQYTQRLCHSGSDAATGVVSVGDCNAVGQADYAEIYPVSTDVSYGDIVVLGSTNVVTEDGDTMVQLVESSSAYESGLVGIAVDNWADGSSIGYNIADSDNPMPIALAGRVPVNVTDENGPIFVGDRITASSMAGYGMKATEASDIVGYALSSHASGTGQVMMFVQRGWDAGSVVMTDGADTLVMDDYVLTSVGEADATTQGYDSYGLSLRGSGWNGSVAEDVAMTMQTTVVDSTDYGLSFRNTADTEVAYLTNEGTFSVAGDLILSGRLYPTDRGTAQTSKYIYYDGSSGAGGDFMRTNASGWATGSYDFAEMFPSDEVLEPGDVVVFAGDGAKVRRSTSVYSDQLAGIVSTRPGFLAGDNEEGSYPIALAGRVPTKVSLENGSIAVGDPLTSSSVSGHAMKATNAGTVVGYALEAFTGSEGDNEIVAFVNASYYGGGDVSTTPGTTSDASGFAGGHASNFTSLNMSGNIFMSGFEMTAIGRLAGLSNNWGVDIDGTFMTKGSYKTITPNYQLEPVETSAMTSPYETITLTGSGELQNGLAEIRFEEIEPSFNDIISTVEPIHIIVTPNGPANLYVSEKNQNGFTVKQHGGSSNYTFDFIATAYRRGFEPEEPTVDKMGPDVETEEVVEEEIGEDPTEEVVEDPAEEEGVADEPDEESVDEEIAEEPVEEVVDPIIEESTEDVVEEIVEDPIEEEVIEESVEEIIEEADVQEEPATPQSADETQVTDSGLSDDGGVI